MNIKKDFPILKTKMNNKRLIYLDNAASSLTPEQVLKATNQYYHEYRTNVHRTIYSIGEKATTKF